MVMYQLHIFHWLSFCLFALRKGFFGLVGETMSEGWVISYFSANIRAGALRIVNMTSEKSRMKQTDLVLQSGFLKVIYRYNLKKLCFILKMFNCQSNTSILRNSSCDYQNLPNVDCLKLLPRKHCHIRTKILHQQQLQVASCLSFLY